MKKNLNMILALTIFTMAPFVINAESLNGEEIMTRVDERYNGESSRQITEMQLINRRGSTRTRKLLSYSKDYGTEEKTVMVFREPSDVEGVGYLSNSYDEIGRDDDTWLFLPALKRSRRISGSSRNDYFMGTDFTYDDMGDRKVEEDRHAFLREEELNGHLCWVVESIPLESRDMYSKRISWIRQDIDMAVKVDYYDRQGEFLKTLEIPQIRQIDNIWTAEKMVMTNHLENHTTILEFYDVRYNIPVEDTFFSVATLERGRIQ